MTMGIGDITIVKSTETWDYKKKSPVIKGCIGQ
jgi:hypothetical protein